MAKKKKNSQEPNPKILQPKDVSDSIKKLDNLEPGEVVTIPPQAVVNVPISGVFRHAIEDTLHYVMSDMTSEQIVVVMHRIRTGFKNVTGEASLQEKSLWTLMSLLAEINYQAANQNLTVKTDADIKEEMAGIINSMNAGDVESAKNMAEYHTRMKNDPKNKKSTEDSN
jgi:hypothetical protein